MIRRASFAVIALFWVLMNALLWRSEFAGQKIAAAVPPGLVWEKILTAPDDSSLSINFEGRKLGYVRLRPNVNEAAATGKVASENEPEGIVRKVSEYTLELEGSIVAQTITRAIRFNGEFAFHTDHTWKRFRTQTLIRPYTWEVKGDAAERELWIESRDGESEWIQRFTPEDLRNPQRLATVLESPALAALLPQLLPAVTRTNAALSLGLHWEARYEWLQIGSSKVRIYRLEAKLLDRHRLVVLVSRVGEILRIELPGELKLVNDILYAG
jgi:hypothetical protein